MRKSTALYYPNIEPPIAWLRSAALFFDTVTSFLPAESNEAPSEDVRQFADTTGAWTPYAPTEDTALLVDVPSERLDRAFAAIAALRKRDPKRATITFLFKGAGRRIEDHVFLHASKVSERVLKLLYAHRLVVPSGMADPIVEDFGFKGKWLIVDEMASDAILAHIADRLAARQGWTSITDNEGCFSFNALDIAEADVGKGHDADAEAHLARMMVTELVPDGIEAMPIKEYAELRRRYVPIREKLATFVNEVAVENRLSQIADTAELRRAAQDAVADLAQEVQSFRDSPFGAGVRKWGPFALGSCVSLAAPLMGPMLALPLAGAAVLFGAVDKTGWLDRKVTRRGELVRLMAAARKDIIRSVERVKR